MSLLTLVQIYWALTYHRRELPNKITELRIDDHTLSITRASRVTKDIPMQAVRFAEYFHHTIWLCYRGNEELLRMELRRKDFDPAAWSELRAFAEWIGDKPRTPAPVGAHP